MPNVSYIVIVTFLETNMRNLLEPEALKFHQKRRKASVRKIGSGNFFLELERIDDSDASTVGCPSETIRILRLR